MFLYLETLFIFVPTQKQLLSMRYFETKFLDEVDDFISKLDKKTAQNYLQY